MLLSGKRVADKIKADIIHAVEEYKKNGQAPKIAILRVGAREDDVAYEERVLKNCRATGIEAKVVEVDLNIDMQSFVDELNRLNEDTDIHGILIFRPLPEHLDMEEISKIIKPEKDIDCMSPVNVQKVFTGDSDGITPCTPEAVIEILKHYGYDLQGRNVAIVNRSMVLGKPLAMLFLAENATVTICHSKTRDLKEITKMADIAVTGIGKGKFFGPDYFSKDSIVIDVGINFAGGKLCGDVDFDKVSGQVSAISPVPGGVGTVTSMILLSHVIKAMKLQKK
ncbi:MAG: bifunctional 5,10-methylenetetrahydrofolate dehydrogenase/5,10-methenyltetrahydrofolate cyclohydrolase [Bacillota bacterium]|jgi:methylenetetrahydrofolate dehydrogenase (NADP+)/methenyltetrahydrofolate cyclohydrolase|nr:bifunctional 5,10-methylenetetrahydrofolate dehydrogenase/5,10-methenyltetrahydrofolate cyclohydrolase [Bacillota bacterium]